MVAAAINIYACAAAAAVVATLNEDADREGLAVKTTVLTCCVKKAKAF